MRFLLVLALVAVAYGGTMRDEHLMRNMSPRAQEIYQKIADAGGEVEIYTNPEDGNIEIAPQSIVAWQARRFLRKVQKQMPCGFPEYGIPPLAPFKISEASLHFERGIFETTDDIYHFLLYGLDKLKIEKLKLNIFSSKIQFDFLFPNMDTIIEKYWTDTLLDAMRQLGLSIEYEGTGSFALGLKNLRVSGELKYKMPLIVGSIKITELTTKVSLEKCTCELTGFMGEDRVNEKINRKVEDVIERGINNNQAAISDLISEILVPRVNNALEGKDFWNVLDIILQSVDGESEDDPIVVDCDPPADPWA